MAGCAFVSRFSPLVRKQFCCIRSSSRTPLRAFSCAVTCFQIQTVEGTCALTGKVDRFGGVSVNLAEIGLPADISENSFSRLLQDSLVQWKAEGKMAVWLQVPISLSRCAAAAATHGFTFHHTKSNHAVLALWLGEGESRLPGFATHQVGVAETRPRSVPYGTETWDDINFHFIVQVELEENPSLFTRLWHSSIDACPASSHRKLKWPVFLPPPLPELSTESRAVVDESTGKVLVVQDKNKTKNAWKFPGGLSDPGENIGATAVREVFEETGVQSEFRSLLSIRQQHNHPGAFGISDMYIICRLSPLTYDINFCTQECLRCDWLDLSELARTSSTTPITSRIARLLLHGLEHGFNKIDLTMEQLPAVYSGMFYQLYHRQLPTAQRS